MVNTIRQLQDLKEWAQDSTRYERRLNFRLAQKPYNWEEGNWWDLDDESVGNTKILEDFEITDEMRRRPNAEGGVQQLVQPGQPGVRQGYATSKTPSKKFKYKITNQSGTVWSDNPPGGWEGDYLKMVKDPKHREFVKKEADKMTPEQKEESREKAKDNRISQQSTQQSKLIEQRKNNLPPVNFESNEDSLDGFDLAEFEPR